MPNPRSSITVHDERLPWLPWLVRLVVGLGVPILLIAADINTYGLEREGSWSLGAPMTWVLMLMGFALAVPFLIVEGLFARRRTRVWLQCVMAALSATIIGWFAALPVGLRFFGSTDPTEQQYVEMAVSTYVVMTAACVVVLLLFRRRRPALKG